MIKNYHANGKLLLTGEYFVLDGALALALPCKPGQSLNITETKNSKYDLTWRSFDEKGTLWFEAAFSISDFSSNKKQDPVATTLQKILLAIRAQNKDFLKETPPILVETHLDFHREWGLGTSSTLIYNLAQWSGVNAFQLLEDTFGGSGYDIACAGADGPVLFQKKPGMYFVENSNFNPSFSDHLFFVYLGKKQNSREGIKRYREKIKSQEGTVNEMTFLTKKILDAERLYEFELLIQEHEDLISRSLNLEKVQDIYFKDFPGTIKSLGAWGGDFVLVASPSDETITRKYFNERGFDVFFNYNDLIL